MTALSQRDPRWGNLKLGFSDLLIKDSGCTITCIAMIVGTTPDVVNERLKSVNGFLGSLVIWAKIAEAFLGILVNRVWSYNNDDVKNNVPNVLVEVPAYPIGGSGRHWIVYIGDQNCNDPWTGLVRPTSDFPNPSGYCILTGKWQDIPQPIPDPTNNGNTQTQRQIIIDSYKALTDDYPTDDEINFRLQQNLNTMNLITDICANDSRFGIKWYPKPVPPPPADIPITPETPPETPPPPSIPPITSQSWFTKLWSLIFG